MHEQEVKLRIPSPPPSPPRQESWQQGASSKKKGKKEIEKALAAGKTVDKGYFRTIYGDQVPPLAHLIIPRLAIIVRRMS